MSRSMRTTDASILSPSDGVVPGDGGSGGGGQMTGMFLAANSTRGVADVHFCSKSVLAQAIHSRKYLNHKYRREMSDLGL